MTDQDKLKALIARDSHVTEEVFFKEYRPLFLSVIKRVFDNQSVNYDEIINELYLLLMENDAQRLRQFRFSSTLYQWLKTTCIRHCLKLKTSGLVIDEEKNHPLEIEKEEGCDSESTQAKMDVDALLGKMRNKRYAKVIRMLMIEGMSPQETAQELCVTVDNLYNIKRRAMAALADVSHKDQRHYER